MISTRSILVHPRKQTRFRKTSKTGIRFADSPIFKMEVDQIALSPRVEDNRALDELLQIDKFGDEEERAYAKSITTNSIEKLRETWTLANSKLHVPTYFWCLGLHIIAFMICGPLTFIPCIFTKTKRFLLYNMHFFRCTPYFFFQLLHWLVNISALVMFIKGSEAVDWNTLALLCYGNLTRCSSIAGKYGTFQKEQIHSLGARMLSKHEINPEMMLHEWAGQTHEIVASEVDIALRKSCLSKELLFIKFLDNNEKLLPSDIRDSKGVRNLEFKKHKATYYEVSDILIYLIRLFNNKYNGEGKLYSAVAIFTMLYILTPGFIRVYVGEPFVNGGVIGIVLFIGTCFSSFIFMLNFFIFWSRYVLDLCRRIFLLKEISKMISISEKKRSLPLIDITCINSIHTWMTLKEAAERYGSKYFYRHTIFLPVIFLCSFVNYLLVCDSLFLQNLGGLKETDETKKFRIFAFGNFALTTAMACLALFLTGLANSAPLAMRSTIHANLVNLREASELNENDSGEGISGMLRICLSRWSLVEGNNFIIHSHQVISALQDIEETLLLQLDDNSIRLFGKIVNTDAMMKLLVFYVSSAATLYQISTK